MKHHLRRAMHWLSANGFDLLFWGCTALAIGNVVGRLSGPEEMQGKFFAMAVAHGGVAGLLYVGDKPTDDDL